MDDKTYNRMSWGCSCGHVARSAIAEARHRHNFPLLCRKPKAVKSKGKVHFDTGHNILACGAETSWRRRMAAKAVLDLPRTKVRADVTCENCLRSWRSR